MSKEWWEKEPGKSLVWALAWLTDALVGLLLFLLAIPLVEDWIARSEAYQDCFSGRMPYGVIIVFVVLCLMLFEIVCSGSPGKRQVGLKFFYPHSEKLLGFGRIWQIFQFYMTAGAKGAELRRIAKPTIDVFIAIPVLLVLCAMVLPGSLSSPEIGWSKSAVKANMHTLRRILETYAVDNNGTYPATLIVLEKAGREIGSEYWKDFTNPYSGLSAAGSLKMEALPHEPGFVTYDPVIDHGKVVRYYIYGYHKEGKRIKAECKDYVLTNS